MYDKALYDKLIARIRIDDATGCWLWTGPIRPSKWPQNRYGMTSWKGRHFNTHRAMVVAVHGPQPRHICACHRCDVPLCINPAHLFLGTMGDNIRDSRSKNRHHEAQKEYCERGHPLSGDNLYLHSQGGKKRGIRRACKTCQRAHGRLAAGWPEHLAYDMNFKVPAGYKLDLTTLTCVAVKRSTHSASTEQK